MIQVFCNSSIFRKMYVLGRGEEGRGEEGEREGGREGGGRGEGGRGEGGGREGGGRDGGREGGRERGREGGTCTQTETEEAFRQHIICLVQKWYHQCSFGFL